MAIEVSGKSPMLVKVIACAADCCPSGVAEKLSEAEFSTSVGAAAPVPLKATVCVPAPSVKVSVPATTPICVGVNSTCTWQLLFAASVLVPQELFNIVNGEVMVTLLRGIAEAVLLPATTCCGVELVPTTTCPKLMVEGARLTAPVGVPAAEVTIAVNVTV